MSVMKEVEINFPEVIELPGLDERERMIVQLFRQLDEVQQLDILRFLNVLLGAR
ncbi:MULTISPECIES: hypothetical protein [unclassified Pseudomonas]|uniref:hypothetical protein n=1 Tax=unclassified Pseudomonas TaxID=196821 RepID=UPI0012DDC8A9|nr:MULTISPECIES: hypothetical protein [unclassified Pseudomonas]UVM63280.1 hypothetical protein LOY50_09630 [Pseudomonas sp. B21-010]